jgi:hypothetical protein
MDWQKFKRRYISQYMWNGYSALYTSVAAPSVEGYNKYDPIL